MTQKQMIERVLRVTSGVSEKLAREVLNEAQDEFADATEILIKEDNNVSSSNANSYTLDDRVIEVKTVWGDGEALPVFQAHRDGETMWEVEPDDTLVVGVWDAENETMAEATDLSDIDIQYSARPAKWISANMDTECEFPQRFHSALVHKAIHDLLLHEPQFGESDLARKRELFSLWKEDLREAEQIANKRKDGSRYTIKHHGF